MIIDAYGYFYQYHNRNQIKLVVKKGLHPEVRSDGFFNDFVWPTVGTCDNVK